MITCNEVERMRLEAVEFNQYSIRLWIVLSLILSLASIFILSRRPLLDHRAVYAVALIVPISCGLLFRNRIRRFGPVVYAAALVGMLTVGVYFGI
jgi:hypothetical protein